MLFSFKIREADGYESDSSSSVGGANNIIARESLSGSPAASTSSASPLAEGLKLNTSDVPIAVPGSFSGRESRDRDRVFKKQISNFLEKISRAKSASSDANSSSSTDAHSPHQTAGTSLTSSSGLVSSTTSLPPLGSGVLLKQPCVDLGKENLSFFPLRRSYLERLFVVCVELLYRMIRYLEDNALDTEGLFRVSGNANFIKDLCDKTEYLYAFLGYVSVCLSASHRFA